MKQITLITLIFLITLTLAAVAAGQTTEGTKVAVVNSMAFSENAKGIKKYTAALQSVETEFTPVRKELETMQVRLQTLEKEIRAAGQQGSQAKVNEYDELQRNYKRKAEDAQVRISRRLNEVTAPLTQAIGLALTDYARQKGYAIVFDVSRDKEGLILAIPGKIDITAEFIAFYNAKP